MSNNVNNAAAAGSIKATGLGKLSPKAQEGITALKGSVSKTNSKAPEAGSAISIETAGLLGNASNHPAVQNA